MCVFKINLNLLSTLTASHILFVFLTKHFWFVSRSTLQAKLEMRMCQEMPRVFLQHLLMPWWSFTLKQNPLSPKKIHSQRRCMLRLPELPGPESLPNKQSWRTSVVQIHKAKHIWTLNTWTLFQLRFSKMLDQFCHLFKTQMNWIFP